MPDARATLGGSSRVVRLVHLSDYHAHAVPFYSDGQHDVGGLARLIAYLRQVRAARPDAIVTNGGDVLNIGSPAWSDRYRGSEVAWFNGLVDVMALGNHDVDYGPVAFDILRTSLDHPVLCSNLVDGRGEPVLTPGGRTHHVIDVDGIRIGVFAVAGSDLDELVPPSLRPVPDARFADRLAAAERVVHELRTWDRVNAVVLIGHELHADDVELARAVPGIDLALGTHSHRREDLTTIAGTNTLTMSPYQYGAYVADLELVFTGGALTDVRGGLVPMSPDRPQAPDVAADIDALHGDLLADPAYAHLREPVGVAPEGIPTGDLEQADSPLGNLVADAVLEASGASVAMITASTLREPIAPGTVTVGDVIASLPYDNRVVCAQVTGRQLQELLDISVRHRGTGFHALVAGVRFHVIDGAARDVVVADPRAPDTFRRVEDEATYVLATTDYVAYVAPPFRDVLSSAPLVVTGLETRAIVLERMRGRDAITAGVDGRVGTAQGAVQ